jgi:hypothetical protein
MVPMESQRLLNRPEEKIRQDLMDRLCKLFLFPSQLLVKERAIHQLPHFSQNLNAKTLPKNRRIDLLAYRFEQENLRPLVLFECKHHKPDAAAFQQLLGYNHWIQAPFIAWVSQDYEGLYRISKGGISYLGELRPYEELCKLLRD